MNVAVVGQVVTQLSFPQQLVNHTVKLHVHEPLPLIFIECATNTNTLDKEAYE